MYRTGSRVSSNHVRHWLGDDVEKEHIYMQHDGIRRMLPVLGRLQNRPRSPGRETRFSVFITVVPNQRRTEDSSHVQGDCSRIRGPPSVAGDLRKSEACQITRNLRHIHHMHRAGHKSLPPHLFGGSSARIIRSRGVYRERLQRSERPCLKSGDQVAISPIV